MNMWSFNKKRPIVPLPYRFYALPVAAIILGGLLTSIYLSVSHYRVYTDIGYSSFCAISRSLNCDTVSQSPYSIFFKVPIPIWGVVGYLFAFIALLSAQKPSPETSGGWSLLTLAALVFSLISIVLAVVSSLYIRSYCLMCILSYGINFLLLFYTWLVRNRHEAPGLFEGLIRDAHYFRFSKQGSYFAPLLLLVLAASVTLPFVTPKYWIYAKPAQASGTTTGFTEEGEPWIGASQPKLIVEEFADYQCFQCRKIHFYLRRIVAEHPDAIRLVHRHFPMDDRINPLVQQPYHRGAGKMAMIAIAAGRLGKFWEANDYLFQVAQTKETVSIAAIAEALNLDQKVLLQEIQSPSILKRLEKDLIHGIKSGVTGTPTFVVDGEVYQGILPADVLRAFL